MLDESGRVIRWDNSAEALTGFSQTEIVDHIFWDTLVFPEDAESVRREFERMKGGSFPEILEFRWRLSDGRVRWMECSNFERSLSSAGVPRTAFVAVDTTSSRRFHEGRAALDFIRARDSERFQISRFIHDTVAQNMLGLSFRIEEWRRDPNGYDFARVIEMVERCCRDVRLLGYTFTPPDLGDDGGLGEAIEYHARTLRESGALDIDFRAELEPETLLRGARAVLFAAVHEFTARAVTTRANKKFRIVLKSDGRSVLLEMAGDFGKQCAGDRGYPAIRERVGALGGRLEMAPDSVRIAIPVELATAA
jgi:PAS domain S-box-containing protein